ncbi:hypothetical protein NECAME_10878 [Necator americanus]|uniref:Uncharacterized protein n=1 Tax=Necator americanus TaxID=51031 RepID=W2T9G5_NECAM|nr:hypothetical protein NECAME_10878 [Necator americanus]ETN77632.1 hypothetical protein NECAME_10878 [Necator americanus]
MYAIELIGISGGANWGQSVSSDDRSCYGNGASSSDVVHHFLEEEIETASRPICQACPSTLRKSRGSIYNNFNRKLPHGCDL